MRGRAPPDDLRAAVRALLPLPRLAAPDRQPQTGSGRPHTIHRCAACGTAMWSEYGGVRTLRFLRVGSLDDPAALPPDVHIHTRSRLPWVALPAGVPAFDACYESRTLWPGASLARRRAMLP